MAEKPNGIVEAVGTGNGMMSVPVHAGNQDIIDIHVGCSGKL